jgi:hypothetical protein
MNMVVLVELSKMDEGLEEVHWVSHYICRSWGLKEHP